MAFREMLENICHGGKIAMLGIPPAAMAIDWRHVIFNMLTIKGIYGREMFETWYKMTVMLESGLDITPVITHRFSWRDYEKGFDVMRTGEAGKVIPSLPPLPAGERELDRLFYTVAASTARRAVSADVAAGADVTDEDLFAFHFDLQTGRPRIEACWRPAQSVHFWAISISCPNATAAISAARLRIRSAGMPHVAATASGA